MMRRIGKFIAVGLLAPTIVLLGVLLVPSPFLSRANLGAYSARPAIEVDLSLRCRPDTIYVTEGQRGYSDHEIVDVRCSTFQRMLVEPAETGDIAAMQELLKRGANANSPGWPASSGNGFVPAWYSAIWKKQTEAVQVLLDNGVDVNSSYSCCMTHNSMLMQTIQARDIETSRMLIARGADIGFVDDFGWGVVDAAEESDNAEIKSLILSACNASMTCRARTRGRKLGILLGITEKPE